MVLPGRLELPTSPLPMECSTTELRQHGLLSRVAERRGSAISIAMTQECSGPNPKNDAKTASLHFQQTTAPNMNQKRENTVETKRKAREERLTEQLRANLRRRKGQAKARSTAEKNAPKPD